MVFYDTISAVYKNLRHSHTVSTLDLSETNPRLSIAFSPSYTATLACPSLHRCWYRHTHQEIPAPDPHVVH